MKINKITIIGAFLLTASYYAISNLVAYLLLFTNLVDYDSNPDLWNWSPSILALISSVIIVILILLLIKSIQFVVKTKKDRINILHAIYSVLLGFLMILMQHFFVYFSDFIYSTNQASLINSKQMDFQYWLLPTLISFTIIHPIGEELFFRKIIFRKIKENHQLLLSILISSVLFASIHFPDIRQTFIALIGGIIAAIIYHKFQKILYPILFHITWNLAVIVSNFTSLI